LEPLLNVNLKDWNSFGIAEIAQQCWPVTAAADIPELLDRLSSSGPQKASSAGQLIAPLITPSTSVQGEAFLIGGGSNVLITGPVSKPIVRFGFKRIKVIDESPAEAIVEAEAGANWHELVLWCLDRGFFGLENLSLIPGSVGASPVQNIGAYGVEMKDCFHSLDAYDIAARSNAQPQPILRTFGLEQCEFSYRDSYFKRHPQLWIIAVRFKLQKTPKLRLEYGEIKQWLDDHRIRTTSPRDVSNAVIAIRSSKLPDPKKIGNAGSFFKNPVLPKDQVEALVQQSPAMPNYPTPSPLERKVSAAWLIDQCGLKGFRDGDVGVHHAHALVLVNYGQARGKDVLALAHKIQNQVQTRFGIGLEPEPIII
jgi:UDP-N-acetylmuramate dehydrogenase